LYDQLHDHELKDDLLLVDKLSRSFPHYRATREVLFSDHLNAFAVNFVSLKIDKYTIDEV